MLIHLCQGGVLDPVQATTKVLTFAKRRVTEWVAGQLTRSQRDFLAQVPGRITIEDDGLEDILFCHATPYSDEEIFTPVSPPERLTGIFAGVEEQLVVCGHTHMQFERQVGHVSIVNAAAILFLASDQARFISGAALNVDGGLSLGAIMG